MSDSKCPKCNHEHLDMILVKEDGGERVLWQVVCGDEDGCDWRDERGYEDPLGAAGRMEEFADG